MVFRIQGDAIEYVYPVFFGFLTDTTGAISVVKGLMTESGGPVIMTELDNIHFMIL
jgi:hypothetical protein